MPRLIDADEIRKRAVPHTRGEHGYSADIRKWAVLVGDIDDAPTIDPVSLRPKGEWIMRGGKLYCSHCGERAGVARDRDDFWYTKGTDACPHCGADMREVASDVMMQAQED